MSCVIPKQKSNVWKNKIKCLRIRTAHNLLSAESESCEVRIERLDDVAGQLDLQADMLVKIDAHGFEDAVLRGGEKTIRQAKLPTLEVSFLALYQGRMLFPDIAKMLRGWGSMCFDWTKCAMIP